MPFSQENSEIQNKLGNKIQKLSQTRSFLISISVVVDSSSSQLDETNTNLAQITTRDHLQDHRDHETFGAGAGRRVVSRGKTAIITGKKLLKNNFLFRIKSLYQMIVHLLQIVSFITLWRHFFMVKQ